LVLADTALLDTLPARQFRAGYAEVAKYGLIGDAGFFAWLEANWRGLFAGGPPPGAALGGRCRLEAAVRRPGERGVGEGGAVQPRAHPVARARGGGAVSPARLLHGEAIALGMALAFAFSAKRGLLSPAEAERVERHLAAVGLPIHVSAVPGGVPDADRLMDLIAQDKKARRGRL